MTIEQILCFFGIHKKNCMTKTIYSHNHKWLGQEDTWFCEREGCDYEHKDCW